MAVCLACSAACLSIDNERLSIDPLSCENRATGGLGAEVGAVLADVGIGTRSLGWSAQAVSTGETCLDRRRIVPVTTPGDRDPKASSVSGPMRALARSSARSYSARTVVSKSRP